MANQGTLQVVPQSLQDFSTQITGAQTETGSAQAAHSLLDGSMSTAGAGSPAQGLGSVALARNSRKGQQPAGTISSTGGAQGVLDGKPGEGVAAQGGTVADTTAGGNGKGGKGGKGGGCGGGGNKGGNGNKGNLAAANNGNGGKAATVDTT